MGKRWRKPTVTWTFKQVDEGTTHVHLEQTGFKAEQAFNGALYGWQRMANQLEKVLARTKVELHTVLGFKALTGIGPPQL